MGNSGNKTKLLSEECRKMAMEVFGKIDTDGSKSIDKAETLKYWKSNFAKLNTDALFKSVDADGNGTISEDEWIQFWEEVKRSGHSDDEIRDELQGLLEGNSWVYFDKVQSEKDMMKQKNKKNY